MKIVNNARKLREANKARLNLEMASGLEILEITLKLKPEVACIVPEHRLRFDYVNLPTMFRVPHLVELNIGHSLVSRAVFE